jgi:hypothetical protein
MSAVDEGWEIEGVVLRKAIKLKRQRGERRKFDRRRMKGWEMNV